jgi:hypothetical protein
LRTDAKENIQAYEYEATGLWRKQHKEELQNLYSMTDSEND